MSVITAHVYRCYSATDELLYVGITSMPSTRWKNHNYKSVWWRECDRIELGAAVPRDEALRQEREAITAERPRYNRQRVADVHRPRVIRVAP